MRRCLVPALTAVVLGGCSSMNTGFGSAQPPPPAPVASEPAKPEFIVPAAFSQLGDTDRQAAYDAQVKAVSEGKRKPWKGAKGVFGYVDPGAPETKDEKTCRKYTETVYFAGRPKIGSGLGCKEPDGQWRIVN